jgi:hypothetical protein
MQVQSTNSQPKMTTTPPFDPPYKTRLSATEGERWVEVRADGSQIDTTAPAAVPRYVADTPKKPAASRDKSVQAAAVLNVPFAEKDEAKRLGARWDSARKKWYVPQGTDLNAFSRWISG